MHDDSAAPGVALRGIQPFEDLGRHIHRRPHTPPILEVLVLALNRKPKVDDFYSNLIQVRPFVYLFDKQNILRFDVTMQNPHLVQIIYPCEHLSEYLFPQGRSQRIILLVDIISYAPSPAVLQDKVERLIVLKCFVHLNHVRMIEQP